MCHCSQGGTFWLSEVDVYRGPDCNPLLEIGGASLCFQVRAASSSYAAFGAAPAVVLHADDERRDDGCKPAPGGRWSAHHRDGLQDADTRAWHAALSPGQEHAVACFLAQECQAALAAVPTSMAEDERLLTLHSVAPTPTCQNIASTAQPAHPRAAVQPCLPSHCGSPESVATNLSRQLEARATALLPGPRTAGFGSSGNQAPCRSSTEQAWLQCANKRLALQWRLQNKRLLSKVASDLLLQAQLVTLAEELEDSAPG